MTVEQEDPGTVKTTLIAAVSLTACVVLLVVGCAVTPPSVTPTSGETAPEVILQVDRRGGFLPVGADFASVPALTVYEDGRGVTHGPQIAIYPPPALPNLIVHELSEEQLQALSALGEEAGLLAEAPDYGEPLIADAATTVVTINVAGDTWVHEVYALDVNQELPGMDEELPGIDEEAQRARNALGQFIEAATELVVSADDGRSYEADAFAVLARLVPTGGEDTGSSPEEPGVEPQVESQVVPWPLDVALKTADDCVLLEGEEADILRAVLADANTLTRFEQEGIVFEVSIRALLPGEDSCPPN